MGGWTRARAWLERAALGLDSAASHAARDGGALARQLALAVAVAFALLGVVCVDAGRSSMAVTFDEPNHIAAGLEWWQFGSYRQWTENPPLARVAVAALPYVHGQRLPGPEQWDPSLTGTSRIWKIGGDLLYEGDGVSANLARARLGTLPFYLLSLLVVGALAGGARAPVATVLAVGLVSTLPSLLAHAALATTDVAFSATLLLAVLGLWRWFEAPTLTRSAALGAGFGLALLTKLTTLPFFAVVVAAFVAARALARLPLRPLRAGSPLGPMALLGGLAVIGLTAALVTWAGYGFSVGRIADLPERVGSIAVLGRPAERGALARWAFAAWLPMPELFHGLLFFSEHSHDTPAAYLLGHVYPHGVLWFYPVALVVKTPLPFLAALGAATLLAARRWRTEPLWPACAALLAGAGIVVVAMLARFNLGIRHVLVALPLLAVAIGRLGAAWLAGARGPRRWLVAAGAGVLLASQAGIAFGARATELGYFNLLAGSDPAGVLLDSDLDWGQDWLALEREVSARGVRRLSIAYFGVARQCERAVPRLTPLVPGRPVTGWVAISENFYRHRNYFGLLDNPCDPSSWYALRDIPAEPFAWLREHAPVTVVGSSIRLYFIPDVAGADATDTSDAMGAAGGGREPGPPAPAARAQVLK